MSASSTPSYFPAQTNPGFPSTCLRVREQSSTSIGGRSSDNNSSASSSEEKALSVSYHEPRSRTSGGSSCLGPEWPGLGIAVAQIGKEPSSSLPSSGKEVPIGKHAPSKSQDQRQTVPSQPGVAEASKSLYNPMTGFPVVTSGVMLEQGQVGPARGFNHVLPSLPALHGGGGAESIAAKSQSASASLPGGVSVVSTISNLWRAPAALNVSGKGGR